MIEQIQRDADGRYSAFGRIGGRLFIADGETLEEAQCERQVLREEIWQSALDAFQKRIKQF